MIVDFAVEDDYGIAIGRKDRLVAAFEVNNFQAGRAQGADFRAKDTLLIRAAIEPGSPRRAGYDLDRATNFYV